MRWALLEKGDLHKKRIREPLTQPVYQEASLIWPKIVNIENVRTKIAVRNSHRHGELSYITQFYSKREIYTRRESESHLLS